MKDIPVNTKMEAMIVKTCTNELQYYIFESGCVNEYEEECRTHIELLRLLGHKDLARHYSLNLRKQMKKCA